MNESYSREILKFNYRVSLSDPFVGKIHLLWRIHHFFWGFSTLSLVCQIYVSSRDSYSSPVSVDYHLELEVDGLEFYFEVYSNNNLYPWFDF